MKKKFFSRTLAAGLALCMLMPTTALAATTYSITVTLSGPNKDGVEKTISDESSKYGSLSTPLAATVVQIINDDFGVLIITLQITQKQVGRFLNPLLSLNHPCKAFGGHILILLRIEKCKESAVFFVSILDGSGRQKQNMFDSSAETLYLAVPSIVREESVCFVYDCEIPRSRKGQQRLADILHGKQAYP